MEYPCQDWLPVDPNFAQTKKSGPPLQYPQSLRFSYYLVSVYWTRENRRDFCSHFWNMPKFKYYIPTEDQGKRFQIGNDLITPRMMTRLLINLWFGLCWVPDKTRISAFSWLLKYQNASWHRYIDQRTAIIVSCSDSNWLEGFPLHFFHKNADTGYARSNSQKWV